MNGQSISSSFFFYLGDNYYLPTGLVVALLSFGFREDKPPRQHMLAERFVLFKSNWLCDTNQRQFI